MSNTRDSDRRALKFLCDQEEAGKRAIKWWRKLEIVNLSLTEFEDNDPVMLLRLCAKTLESPSNWHKEIMLARANWLRRFASHLEKARDDAENS